MHDSSKAITIETQNTKKFTLNSKNNHKNTAVDNLIFFFLEISYRIYHLSQPQKRFFK